MSLNVKKTTPKIEEVHAGRVPSAFSGSVRVKKSFPPLVVIKVVALVIQSSGVEETNLSHLNANLSSAEDSVQ